MRPKLAPFTLLLTCVSRALFTQSMLEEKAGDLADEPMSPANKRHWPGCSCQCMMEMQLELCMLKAWIQKDVQHHSMPAPAMSALPGRHFAIEIMRRLLP